MLILRSVYISKIKPPPNGEIKIIGETIVVDGWFYCPLKPLNLTRSPLKLDSGKETVHVC